MPMFTAADNRKRSLPKRIDMTPALRETMILQTKCGIRKGSFDFSKEHILEAVDGSLKRLHTDYLDVLLLHRPDALVEPEEVAEAFTILQDSGKVRHFGVSNQNPMQIELLTKFVKQPIVFNQLQFSITNTGMIDAGINVNMEIDPSDQPRRQHSGLLPPEGDHHSALVALPVWLL